MRVRKIVFLVLCAGLLGLTACGKDTESSGDDGTVSSITIKKDGTIIGNIVEDFGESYYDADSLKSMIETSISEYKSSNATAQITLKSCKATDNVVTVNMEYGDYSSYAGFNEEYFFAGTVTGANQSGFDLNVSLKSVSDDASAISKPQLLEMGDNHIVILEADNTDDDTEPETVRVNCYGEILYVSDGVTVVGKKSADVKLTEGYGIIVFK
jgi:hypothetical protein